MENITSAIVRKTAWMTALYVAVVWFLSLPYDLPRSLRVASLIASALVGFAQGLTEAVFGEQPENPSDG